MIPPSWAAKPKNWDLTHFLDMKSRFSLVGLLQVCLFWCLAGDGHCTELWGDFSIVGGRGWRWEGHLKYSPRGVFEFSRHLEAGILDCSDLGFALAFAFVASPHS